MNETDQKVIRAAIRLEGFIHSSLLFCWIVPKDVRMNFLAAIRDYKYMNDC